MQVFFSHLNPIFHLLLNGKNIYIFPHLLKLIYNRGKSQQLTQWGPFCVHTSSPPPPELFQCKYEALERVASMLVLGYKTKWLPALYKRRIWIPSCPEKRHISIKTEQTKKLCTIKASVIWIWSARIRIFGRPPGPGYRSGSVSRSGFRRQMSQKFAQKRWQLKTKKYQLNLRITGIF